MLKTKEVTVMNLQNAMRGARNPHNSWDRSDSYWLGGNDIISGLDYILGPNDIALAKRLRNAGSDHRKFMRQIFVSMDIIAPLYWWKEFDTYKVGTCANSSSTMHRLHKEALTREDISCENMLPSSLKILDDLINEINLLRVQFNETKDKKYWYSMIQLLPSSYNQLRTVTMTYENLVNMYHARKNHKLDEWHQFIETIEKLPYFNELIKGE